MNKVIEEKLLPLQTVYLQASLHQLCHRHKPAATEVNITQYASDGTVPFNKQQLNKRMDNNNNTKIYNARTVTH